MFGYVVFFGATPPSTLLAPSDRLQRGLRADSVPAKRQASPAGAVQVRQYRDERLWGSGGENFDTWKVLKVCSIKGIEPSNALFRNAWEPSLMFPSRYLSGFSDIKGSFYPEGEVVADRQSAGILKMSTPSTIMML